MLKENVATERDGVGRAYGADLWNWPSHTDAKQSAEHELLLVARSMRVARRALESSLPIDFIYDPSLDIMLALFMVPSRCLTLPDLQVATTVNLKVAMRWVDALSTANLVEVHPGQATDRIQLTQFGLKSLKIALSAVLNSQRNLHAQDLH